MRDRSVREVFLIILISLLMLGLGHLIVLQRSWHGTTAWTQMTPDARQYVAMASGEHASAPYAHRILVPYLASLLPSPPEYALRTISYVSLALFYVSVLLALKHLGFTWPVRLMSLACLFSVTNHLYLYSNPYLTDAFGLAGLSVMFRALLSRSTLLFSLSAVLGILGRETTIFLVPAFAVMKRWRELAGVLVLSLCVLILPRALTGGGTGYSSFTMPSSWIYLAQAYLSLGFLWVPLMAGLVLATGKALLVVRVSFACLSLGAVASSTKAADTVRMFLLLLPIAPICWAFYLSQLSRCSKLLTALSMILAVASIALALPTRLLPAALVTTSTWEEFYEVMAIPVVVLHGAGLAVAVLAVLRLRRAGCFARMSRGE